MPRSESAETYAYLGPAGTFSEAALARIPRAAGHTWMPVHNVAEALAAVVDGRATGAVIAIENSVDGGVAATQDALATIPGLRIQAEVVVPVNFVLVARRGTTLADVTTVNAHPVAYAQCLEFLQRELPQHGHIPSSSNVAAAANLLEAQHADAAIAPPTITAHYDLEVLAEHIGDNANAVTRFVLVTRDRELPERTGADKTSLIVELPADAPGALLELLEQFSTRGVNLSLLASRPIGDALGRYRFVIDLEGHIHDERVADALLGVRRFSPSVLFLGSYPRADAEHVEYHDKYDDTVFVESRDWLRGLLSHEPTEGAS